MDRFIRKLNSSPKVKKKQFGVSLKSLVNNSNESNVPRIVVNICNCIMQYGVDLQGIFRINGGVRLMEELKRSFQSSEASNLVTTDAADLYALAGVLKLFLRELPGGLVSEEFTDKFIKGCIASDHVRLIRLIEQLPQENRYLLCYLCQFLSAVAEHADVNRMSTGNLGILFGPCVFRLNVRTHGLRAQSLINQLMTHLIEHHEVVFPKDGSSPFTRDIPSKRRTSLIRTQSSLSDYGMLKSSAGAKPRPSHSANRDFFTTFFAEDPSSPSKVVVLNEFEDLYDDLEYNEPDFSSEQFSDLLPSIESALRQSCNFSSLSSYYHSLPLDTISQYESSRDQASPTCDSASVSPRVTTTCQSTSCQATPTILTVSPTGVVHLEVDTKETSQPNTIEFFKEASSQKTPRDSLPPLDPKGANSIKPPIGGIIHPHRSNSIPPRNHQPCASRMWNSHKIPNSEPSRSTSSMSNQETELFHTPPAFSEHVSSGQDGRLPPMNSSKACASISAMSLPNLLHPTDNDLLFEADAHPPSAPGYFRESETSKPLDRSTNTMNLCNVSSEQSNTACVSHNCEPDGLGVFKSLTSPIISYSGVLNRSISLPSFCLVPSFRETTSALSTRAAEQRKPTHPSSPSGQVVISQSSGLRSMVNTTTPDGTIPQPLLSSLHSFYDLLTVVLNERRSSCGRPDVVSRMTTEQIHQEKVDIQKGLLYFERLHGRPKDMQAKRIMRPLYERYRLVKRLIRSPPGMLIPTSTIPRMSEPINLLDGVFASDARCCPVEGPSHGSYNVSSDSQIRLSPPAETRNPFVSIDPLTFTSSGSMRHRHCLNASETELSAEKDRLLGKKYKLLRELRDFEENIWQMRGRPPTPAERTPLREKYHEYKLVRQKLRRMTHLPMMSDTIPTDVSPLMRPNSPMDDKISQFDP